MVILPTITALHCASRLEAHGKIGEDSRLAVLVISIHLRRRFQTSSMYLATRQVRCLVKRPVMKQGMVSGCIIRALTIPVEILLRNITPEPASGSPSWVAERRAWRLLQRGTTVPILKEPLAIKMIWQSSTAKLGIGVTITAMGLAARRNSQETLARASLKRITMWMCFDSPSPAQKTPFGFVSMVSKLNRIWTQSSNCEMRPVV